MTQHSRACYFARQAADLARYNGLYVKGFSRLPAPLFGAVFHFHHEESGLVILLNATGAVNAKATKAAAARAAAHAIAFIESPDSVPFFDLEEEEAPRSVALRIIPKAGGFELHNEDGVWIGPAFGLFDTEEAARAWGEGRPAYYGGPVYTIAPAPRRAPLPAFCLPLAPVKAAPAPLWPVAPRRAFAELAAVMGGR